jgi:Ca2+-binding EF-hand superfamily protein
MGLKGVGPGQQREVGLICQEIAILGDVDFFTFCFELVPRVKESLAQMNRAALHETFETYDTDGNGSLSEEECKEILKKLVGANIDSIGTAQLEDAFHEALTICRRPDEDEIQFDRFEQLFSRLAQGSNRIRNQRQDKIANDEGLNEAEIAAHKNEILVLYDSFCRADIDSSGKLSKHEVRGMILEHGLMPKDAAAYNRMISDADNIFGGKDLTFRDCLVLFRRVRADQERNSEAELGELFKLYDRDLSGELNMVEISAVLSDYGLTPRCREDQEAIKQLLDEIDADGSGTFEFPEFLKLIQRIEERMQALQFQREAVVAKTLGYSPAQVLELRDCFCMLDTDGSGSLGVDELREVLDAIRINKTSDQLKELTMSLGTPKSVEINTPLLDFEGFMRFANEIGYTPSGLHEGI